MKRIGSAGVACFFSAFFPLTASALFTSEAPTQITETQLYQYDVLVHNGDEQPVSVKLVKGPKGMTLTSRNSLVWQTTYDDAGRHDVVLEATSGDNTVQQAFTVVVANKNRAPLITSMPSTQLKETAQFHYEIKAQDPDGDDIRIELLELPKVIKREGNVLSWQTDYNSAGLYSVHIRVSDGQTHTDQAFVLTVENVNRAPVFTPLARTQFEIDEYQEWQLALSATDGDGDRVSLSLQKGPEGMSFDGTTLRFKPNYQQAGNYDIVVRASDGKDVSDIHLTMTVNNVNRLPTFISQPVTRINEAELYRYDVRAYDPDETPLRYRLVKAPKGMQLNNQQQLIWQTGYNDAGKYDISIEVSDGEASISQDFQLEVVNKNRPVQITSTPITQIREGEHFSYTFTAHDADNDPFTIEYLTVPSVVTRKDNVFTWQTNFKSAGSYPFHIRVTEAESSTEQRFTLVVENVNHKPVITSTPPTNALEVVDYEYQIIATDADDEPLTYKLLQAPQGMLLHGNNILWKPAFNQAGNQKVVVSVSDGIDTVTQEFEIFVSNTNREPNIVDIADQTVYLGDNFRYQLDITDVDGDPVVSSLVRSPDKMRLSKRHELSWKPSNKDLGEHIIIVSASDGDLTTRKHFRINVVPKPAQ